MRKTLFIILILSCSALSSNSAKLHKADSRLRFLYWQSQNPTHSQTLIQSEQQQVTLSIRTTHPLPHSTILEWKNLGIHVKMLPGVKAPIANIYTVHAPLSLLPELAKGPNIISIEYYGPELRRQCLNVSTDEIQASRCWSMIDKRSLPITGKGVTVGIVDNPPDIFHPMFWRADGDTLNWIDVNQNGQFDSGVDVIDMNENSTADNNESLNFINAPIIDPWGIFEEINGEYDPAYDWLYLDINQNGQRDYGIQAGFTESDPTFGEPLFICQDLNDNGRLDPSEPLIALKSCKVKSIYYYAGLDEDNQQVYKLFERGQNLIELDKTDSHGTAVGGIVAGGVPGITAITGIAPDVDLVYGEQDFLAMTDIDVILYEQGRYSQQFLDGCSHDEICIDSLAARGTIPVVPSGNMNQADVHMEADINSQDSATVSLHWPDIESSNGNPFFISFLWNDQDADFGFTLHTPEGTDYYLSNDEHIANNLNYQIWATLDTSGRGTLRYDIVIFKTERVSETWKITINNKTSSGRHIDGYVYDPRFGWNHQAKFLSHTTKNVTLTAPSTADSAITVGSYNTRDTNETSGDLSGYSGRGPRIDGKPGIDITAPGKLIFTSDVNSKYTQFSGGYWGVEGTSFSGPHAAGTIALMLQLDPDLSVKKIKELLAKGAAQDNNTGTIPNSAWGAGKIRVINTLKQLPQFHGNSPNNEGPDRYTLLQNYPNPFNSNTSIEFYLDADSKVSVKVYNIRGRLVSTILDDYKNKGLHTINWHSDRISSGIYFIMLSTYNTEIVKKCTILR